LSGAQHPGRGDHRDRRAGLALGHDAGAGHYLWTLHERRPDLILTVAVPGLVDRHWWHRILHEHVAERLQLILRSLPRAVVTGVPFHLAD
jgi:hypothetical protein